MAEKQFDFIIIGAGIVGCLIARRLSRFKLRVLLLDKESDVGTGASAANTAIIHSGYYPVPGTLKARMNSAGNPLWDELSGDLNFSFKRNGGFVVAIGEPELASLGELRQRGEQNGVTDITLISGHEMRKRQPGINPSVSGALWIPSIGICDPFGAVIAAAENALANGVKLLLNTKFEDFIWKNSQIRGIKTNRGIFHSRWVVNASGVYADEVMHKARLRPEFKITPVKGEYYIFDNTIKVTSQVIFPVPTAASKGILVTNTMHGNIMIGPTTGEIPEKDDHSVTQSGMDQIWKGATNIFPGLNRQDIIAAFAGLRATGNALYKSSTETYSHDFVIEINPDIKLVNLGGIDSPGLTSAPAIAALVMDLLKDAGENWMEKPDWNPLRPARPHFRDLGIKEKKKLIQKDPRYGCIICRCETVTEGEVRAEINSPIPARTYDAIKRRTWLGTGRCQGSFDIPRVIKILADETGLRPEKITKKGAGSEYLSRPTKAANK